MLIRSLVRLAAVALLMSAPLLAAPVRSDNLILPLGSATQILIPAAGSVQGGNGQFFRSDINVVNYSDHDQRVFFNWLPQGVTGTTVVRRQTTIPARKGIQSDDFVASFLQLSGLGAILITGVDSNGVTDATARLYATSRIWSNQPGLSSGTVSQTFSAIPTSAVNSTRLTLLGMKRDNDFRLNVGLVNLANTDQTLQISIGGSNSAVTTMNVTVPAFSMVQTPVTGAALTNVQVAITNATAISPSTSWIAYGSSVDNVTGDSWSEIGYISPQDATP